MREPTKSVERLRERAQHSDQIVEADRETLMEFSDRLRLLKSEYGDYRHEKLLRHCVMMAEEGGGLAMALEDRDAAEDIVRWIHRNYPNEETSRDYRTALRMLGKRTGSSEELPESLDWIPSGYSCRGREIYARCRLTLYRDVHISRLVNTSTLNPVVLLTNGILYRR